jgi:hypothetical protein
MAAIEEHLQKTYGDPAAKQTEGEKPAGKKSRWIEIANDGGIYLNQRLLQSVKLNPDDVARELATWLATQPTIQAAYSRPQLMSEIPATDEIGRRVQKSFQPDRSGDVIIVLKPYYLLTSRKTGTNHGTPNSYDTHVPLMVYGPGIKPGTRTERVTPQSLAAILARAIGVPAPAKAEAPVPNGLFE